METTKTAAAPVNPCTRTAAVWVVCWEEWGATIGTPLNRTVCETPEEAEAECRRHGQGRLNRPRREVRMDGALITGYTGNKREGKREGWAKTPVNAATR